jgi:hypothetical protein
MGELKVVGAGLPRTGTHSLRIALQQLLGGSCYHMSYLFERENVDVPAWQAAADGREVDWGPVFDGCTAAVDWPASAFWRELSAANPDAIIVLSVRDDPATWWRSADKTVWPVFRQGGFGEMPEDWFTMVSALLANTFGDGWDDPDSAMASYERWNADVQATAPAERLLVWNAKQGWGPLCERLGVPVPDEPFPVTNTTEEWLQRDAERTGDEQSADA